MHLELNSLDLEVKYMMLEYPSLFPTRIHCLAHLFCTNGNGYDWQADGTLSASYYEDSKPPMPEHIAQEESRMTWNGSAIDHHEQVRLEYEKTVRAFREKHIDFLCTQFSSGITPPMAFTSVYPMSWGYCAMLTAAERPELIADEWRAGIREFIRWYLPKVNSHYGCRDHNSRTVHLDRIGDERTKINYLICQHVMATMKTDGDYLQAKLARKQLRKSLPTLKVNRGKI